MNTEDPYIKINSVIIILLCNGLIYLTGLDLMSFVFIGAALLITMNKKPWKCIIIWIIFAICCEIIFLIRAVNVGAYEFVLPGFWNELIENIWIKITYNILTTISLLYALYLFTRKDVIQVCKESNEPEVDF